MPTPHASSSSSSFFDLIIVGGGPAGMAAAIAAKRRGLRYVVLEKGGLVQSLADYPTDMVFFTTPELLEIGGLPFVSPHDKPTRQEALKYYRKVCDAFDLDVRFDEPVTSIVRGGDGIFTVTSAPKHAPIATRQAPAVVVATGAYDIPNWIDVPGEDLPHVSHYYRGPHLFYRKRVVIVGGKNSAAEAALDLFRNGAGVTIVHRREALGDSIKYWVKPDIENRIKEGSIGARFSTVVREITPTHVHVDGPAGPESLPADGVLLLTGYRSDTSLLRDAGAAIDESILAPVHDPETYETTVPMLFVIGACIAGRQSGRIFIENGRFHGEVAVARIAERLGTRASSLEA